MKPMKAGMNRLGFVLCLFLFGCTPRLIITFYWCSTWVLMLSPASSYQEALKMSNQQTLTKRHLQTLIFHIYLIFLICFIRMDWKWMTHEISLQLAGTHESAFIKKVSYLNDGHRCHKQLWKSADNNMLIFCSVSNLRTALNRLRHIVSM